MAEEINYIKLPKPLIQEIDRYIQNNKHLGYITRTEVVKVALREILKNNGNGGAYSTTTHDPISPKKENGENDQK